MTPITRKALSIEEAVKASGISRTKLYEFISSGELPSCKLGRRRVVRPEALDAWLASKEQRAA
jgi:excisionase family DNA binding protein